MKNQRKTACPEISGNWYKSTNSNFFQSRKNRDWKRLGTAAILTCIPKKIGTSLRSALLTLLTFNCFANNVTISAISAPATNQIQFNISWENSWYFTTPPANWDAVWVFVKVQVCGAGYNPWTHANVSATSADHTVSGGVLQVDAVTDSKGVFIRRNSSGIGSGNIATATVVLTFTGSYTIASTNYQVIGIEMVQVPQSSFQLGDGNTSTNSFGTPYTYAYYGSCTAASTATTYSPVTISGEGAATVYINAASNAVAAALPKGYNAFYCMKYEVSQQQYVTFLNSLDYTQQENRTAGSTNANQVPSKATGTAALVTSGTYLSGENRNSIEIKTPGTATTIPAVYGNDLNNNNTYDEADDGGNIACNFLSWEDLKAYLDWAALRPMTELEYEKACRGGSFSAIPGEYVWGNNTILAANSTAISFGGQATEVSTSSGNGLCDYNYGASTSVGPLRTGFAATASTDRSKAGASYYGILDLGGNVWEQCWYAIGSIFSGVLGDGAIDANGSANQTNWSNGDPSKSIVRGGNWYDVANRIRTSDRNFAGNTAENATRIARTGGRGVR